MWDFLLNPLLTSSLRMMSDLIPRFLLQLGLDRKWQMNASCVVECPVNCQLSDWSAWSECTHTCGLAGMRARHQLPLNLFTFECV